MSSISPFEFGVSFSIKQCRNFDLNPTETLSWLITDMGFKRFRLMSYWDEHEKQQGVYDFTALDKQIYQIGQVSGVISLCLGVRQPRWPESHWPEWALKLPQAERYAALEKYIQIVVERYKTSRVIESYQLENEALNRTFGLNGDFNRKRLRSEYNLVRQLDPVRHIIMTTSNSWGLPLRWPIPNVIGFSLYRIMYVKNGYAYSKIPIWLYGLRAFIARHLLNRPSFIHELQCEPWGPKAIWEMPTEEQDKSMSPEQIKQNVQLAKQTSLLPIDLWGGEWWYWRLKHDDPTIMETVKKALAK